MRIYNNISAMTAYRSLSKTDGAITKSMEKLSTGLRINTAADDATGLVISEKMRNQITGFGQAIKNSQQGMSMLKTAEGAMGQQGELLGRIRELVVSANSGNMTADNRATIQTEIGQLVEQIDDIAKNTQYNGIKLMDGSLGSKLEVDTNVASSDVLAVNGVSEAKITGATKADTYTFSVTGTEVTLSNGDDSKTQTIDTANAAYKGDLNFDVFGITMSVNISDVADMDTKKVVVASNAGAGVDFQVGSNDGQKLNVKISNMDKATIGDNSAGKALQDIDVTDLSAVSTNLGIIDNAIDDVSTARASMGSYINRFEAGINNLTVTKENLQASESLVRDLDMADEMVQLTRNQVLSQASTAMLAQANQKPQAILQLLR